MRRRFSGDSHLSLTMTLRLWRNWPALLLICPHLGLVQSLLSRLQLCVPGEEPSQMVLLVPLIWGHHTSFPFQCCRSPLSWEGIFKFLPCIFYLFLLHINNFLKNYFEMVSISSTSLWNVPFVRFVCRTYDCLSIMGLLWFLLLLLEFSICFPFIRLRYVPEAGVGEWLWLWAYPVCPTWNPSTFLNLQAEFSITFRKLFSL